MAFQLVVRLKGIQYSGESIGRDLHFTFRIEGLAITLHKRISKGTTKVFKEILFMKNNVVPDTTIDLPIQIVITEKDQKDPFDENQAEGTIFPIHTVVAKKQTHSFSMNVVAQQGSDKGKKATFTITFEAETLDEAILKCLQPFESDIRQYSVTELNDALVTVFGELTETLHDQLSEEAEAIISTILNRQACIEPARQAYKKAEEDELKAQQEYQAAVVVHDDLARNPSKYRKELGDAEYEKRLAAAKDRYNETKRQLRIAQENRVAAVSKKREAESFVNPSKREQPVILLSDIVAVRKQYKGTKTGKEYVQAYPHWAYPEQQRNCERWKTAKIAVARLAENGSLRKTYYYFVSNENGVLPLETGRTRIGGNDFWE